MCERLSILARFVVAAVEAGAHDRPPLSLRHSKPKWERNVNFAIVCCLAGYRHDVIRKLNSNLEKPITQTRVSFLKRRTISWLWQNCPTGVQNQFPWGKLLPHMIR